MDYFFVSCLMRRLGKNLWFFFSSRRRHTRYWRDWSSDVCSSDLVCLLYGVLIFRSRFLPRFLGVLMVLAGLCYAGNSILVFLDLHVVQMSGVPLLLVPAGLSELILCLWLLIVGVDVPKWHLWSAQPVGQSV